MIDRKRHIPQRQARHGPGALPQMQICGDKRFFVQCLQHKPGGRLCRDMAGKHSLIRTRAEAATLLIKPSITMGIFSNAPPKNTPHSPAMSNPPSAASTPSGSAASGRLTAIPRSITSILRRSPASESPAPRPVISATGRPSNTDATAEEVVVFPMPISPVASSCTPARFCARTNARPAAMACTACARVMAGPAVKSQVPGAMR